MILPTFDFCRMGRKSRGQRRVGQAGLSMDHGVFGGEVIINCRSVGTNPPETPPTSCRPEALGRPLRRRGKEAASSQAVAHTGTGPPTWILAHELGYFFILFLASSGHCILRPVSLARSKGTPTRRNSGVNVSTAHKCLSCPEIIPRTGYWGLCREPVSSCRDAERLSVTPAICRVSSSIGVLSTKPRW